MKENQLELTEFKERVMDYISMLSKGICALTDTMESQESRNKMHDFPIIWKKASILMLELSGQYGINNFLFPLTLDEQFSLWRTPLNQWSIMYFDEIFAENEFVLFDEHVTDYCVEFSNKYDNDSDLTIFKEEILINARADKEYEIYTRIRKFLVEYPTITKDELDEKLFLEFKDKAKKYREYIEKFYEEIPNEYTLGNGHFYTCPYCGWTLKKEQSKSIKFQSDLAYAYRCNTDKCQTHAKEWVLTKSKFTSEKCLRVKPSIQKFISEPGIIELQLYDKLSKIFNKHYGKDSISEVELYPYCDFADIQLKFSNGEVWMVDVKDWVSVDALANKLNQEDLFKSTEKIEFNKGFLIVPSTFSSNYVDKLKARYKNSATYKVLTDRQFIRLVNKTLEVE